ncbi:hypothetical protein MKZ38_001648 [Zalerion maritima]|uniref:Isochorismatase-like domain-containing protein n=1 Tax=Zalerion maritima TaxID=339359 RepID=A0AAD5RFC0_9PEZI|nr:hypothetical protein MKZ38_001648 [Zalerion maritima]
MPALLAGAGQPHPTTAGAEITALVVLSTTSNAPTTPTSYITPFFTFPIDDRGRHELGIQITLYVVGVLYIFAFSMCIYDWATGKNERRLMRIQPATAAQLGHGDGHVNASANGKGHGYSTTHGEMVGNGRRNFNGEVQLEANGIGSGGGERCVNGNVKAQRNGARRLPNGSEDILSTILAIRTLQRLRFLRFQYSTTPRSYHPDSICILYKPTRVRTVLRLSSANMDDPQVIGGPENFWLYSHTKEYDLTHPSTPTSTPIIPRIRLKTAKRHVTIDPQKSALVVIDLQNYFLSPSLGRPKTSKGMNVVEKLVEEVIPACREAGIPIVWLGWGLTDQDIHEMPPAIVNGFATDTNFVDPESPGFAGLGADLGAVEVEVTNPAGTGPVREAGRILMRGEWNTKFDPALQNTHSPQDHSVARNRLSGFAGGSKLEEVLEENSIKTLLFSGINTDQCVAATLQDAFNKGYDCLMLSDACATTSPDYAAKCIEYNCREIWGFVLTCEHFVKGIQNRQKRPFRDRTEKRPPHIHIQRRISSALE